MVVKGNTIGVDVLKEALAALAKDPGFAASPSAPAAGAVPTPSRSQAAAPPAVGAPAATAESAAAAGQSAAATRWTPPAPSAAALAAKAVQEFENAKPFNRVVRIVGGAKVALLSKPDILSQPTGEYLQDGQTAETVARLVAPRDGRVYLRIKGPSGWVSTRSRKCFGKTVVAPASGDPLEPPEYSDPGQSCALDILQAVDSEGKDMLPEGASASSTTPAQRIPVSFRATLSRHPVLSSPSIAVAANSTVFVNCQDKFEADAVHFNPAENRAYLRLRDGRGWICERSKASLHRFAVEPVDASLAVADDGAKRLKTDDGRVVIMRSGATDTAEQPAAQKPAAKGVAQAAVFRSDEEIWPAALRPPKPILPPSREKMRRLFMFYGKRIAEAERDLKEANQQADTYSRSCPAVEELRKFMDGVKKEIAQYNKDWTGAVRQLVAEEGPGNVAAAAA